MCAAFEFGRDDVASAADDDGAADAGEFEDRVAGVMEDGPHRRMNPENFADQCLQCGVLVLVHVPGDFLREILIGEDFLDEVLVEHRPRLRVF